MQGISAIPYPDMGIPGFHWTNRSFYYFVFLWFVVCFFLVNRVADSPFGRGLVGIREGEDRMRALGYNVWLWRYLILIVAGILAGWAGMLYAYSNSFVQPAYFGFDYSWLPMLMVIVGGAATRIGPIGGRAHCGFRGLLRKPGDSDLVAVPPGVDVRRSSSCSSGAGSWCSPSGLWHGSAGDEHMRASLPVEAPAMRDEALRIEGLSKHLAGVRVLEDISFETAVGERLGNHRAERCRKDHPAQPYQRSTRADRGKIFYLGGISPPCPRTRARRAGRVGRSRSRASSRNSPCWRTRCS